MGKLGYLQPSQHGAQEQLQKIQGDSLFYWCWNCEGSSLNIQLQGAAAAGMSDKQT